MKTTGLYTTVSFEEAKAIMDSGEPYVFADVRTEEEYVAEHAAGAELFPLDDITAESAEKLISAKDTAVILYCRTGRRSKLAADLLLSYGFRKIYDAGSLSGWPYGRESGIQ